MEKSTREVLLEAGVAILAARGARAGSARAVEEQAGVPHGTLRHHFGNQSGYLAALADAVSTQVVASVSRRAGGIAVDEAVAVAWLELSLIAQREPTVSDQMTSGYQRLIAALDSVRAAGSAEASQLIALWEGRTLAGARHAR